MKEHIASKYLTESQACAEDDLTLEQWEVRYYLAPNKSDQGQETRKNKSVSEGKISSLEINADVNKMIEATD